MTHASLRALAKQQPSPRRPNARLPHGCKPQLEGLRVPEPQQHPKVHHDRDMPRGSSSAARGDLCCPRRHARSKRTVSVRQDQPRRLARRSSTRSPPGCPRPLERPPAAPSGSRPQVDCFETILSVVCRGAGRARQPCWSRRLRLVEITLFSSGKPVRLLRAVARLHVNGVSESAP